MVTALRDAAVQKAESPGDRAASRGGTAAANTVDAIAEQVAEAARAGGDDNTAEALFAELAQRAAPQTARRGLLGLAWRHFEAGRWQDATDACNQLLKQDSDPNVAAEAALVGGRACEHLDRPDDALAMYRTVVDRYPQSRWSGEAMWRCAAGGREPSIRRGSETL